MEGKELVEGKSLSETPTWAVASVVTVMVAIGFSLTGSLKLFGKWLGKTRRKSLLAALDKIKDELMLFGLLSLLMGHWIVYVAKICVKASASSTRFYACAVVNKAGDPVFWNNLHGYLNHSISRQLINNEGSEFCPKGSEPFASKESLDQLHRFLFVLGVTHISYSFFAIALAMIKIYSWRVWENQARSMALQEIEGSADAVANSLRFRRLATFIYQQTSHPWSEHKVLVWLVCFSRQFWSSIRRADYMSLRLGFITTHQLPLSYDFHQYMLRSMEEEFRDIVGISVPLWIFAIACILLNFHGTNLYLWLSFLPAILILLVGTKLHHIVVKLAIETMNASQWTGYHQFNLRDELFWLGKPRLLLQIIQFVSFQNALEMATFIWSLWEVKEPSCFMQDRSSIVIRLTFGIVSQFWCSFITFPLYVIVTQMGSRFKKSILSENVRKSLHGWRRRVKGRQGVGPSFTLLTTTSTTSLDSMVDDEIERTDTITSSSMGGHSSSGYDMEHGQTHETSPGEKKLQLVPLCHSPKYDTYDDEHNTYR